MHAPPTRLVLPWSLAVGLTASAACLIASLFLSLSLRDNASVAAIRETTEIADGLAGRIEAGIAVFDLLLREAAAQSSLDRSLAARPPLDHPLAAAEVSFVNVLNESGDVIADFRSGTPKPVNFSGRDYFQDQLKNPAGGLAIGRPFAMAAAQNAAIPISRRLNGPNGAFAGVAVAGVRLSWLKDLLSRPSADAASSIAIRRDDGVILMRAPFDLDAIGRGSGGDAPWKTWQRTGGRAIADGTGGLRVYRRLGAAPLVLELSVPPVGYLEWLLFPALMSVPLLTVLAFALAAWTLHRRGERIAAAARAANDDRMRTMANMSHELRTPLTGILGQAELLRGEGGLDERQADRLARLSEAGTLMRDIVDRVIDIARPEDHEAPLPRAATDLDALVRSCRAMVECEAREKGLHLTSYVAPAAPRHPALAGEAMKQVLGNLLMNAVKFTAMGTVELRVMGDADRLRFEVADTGPGIPPGKRNRLFRAYDRLDATGTSAAGTGLGLSITERLIRRMDGKIGQRDNPGGGSVFWVEIPVNEAVRPILAAAVRRDPLRPEFPQPGVTRPDPSQPGPSQPDSGQPDPGQPVPGRHDLPWPVLDQPQSGHAGALPRALRLLLADDDPSNRAVAVGYLRAAGHAVSEVEDGAAAVEAASDKDFDVILTDMRMPGLDGLTAIQRIRALTGHRGQVPIVLVTADPHVAVNRPGTRPGADGHLTKPYNRTELLDAVDAAARLTPVPAAGRHDSPLSYGPPGVETRLSLLPARPAAGGASLARSALRRVEELLILLDRPHAGQDQMVRDAAHDLTGTAGLLGLTGLAESLRRFNAREDLTGARLQEACVDVVRLLRDPDPGAKPRAAADRAA